ncbi:MAG: hypothetical protein LC713_06960 [Actinobacteria bacterium]|nr:hypothetical protein [Actinomycetota bacterium]
MMATTEAVEICHRMAATNRTAFEPDLAGSLNNFSVMLSDVGLQRGRWPPLPKPWTFTVGWPRSTAPRSNRGWRAE